MMMLGIMAGMDQRDFFALFVDPCRDAEVFLMVQTVRRTIEIPQLHVNKEIDAPVLQFVRVPQVVIFLVATQRLIPMVSLTMEIPQLPVTRDRRPCCAGGASSTAAVVETVVLPLLHLLRNSLRVALELKWRFFWALYTGTGPGVVSTGTRPPQLGAPTHGYG